MIYTEKDNKKVNILGTEYTIRFVPDDELKELGADGVCDTSIKLIRVCTMDSGNLGDLSVYQKKVLRHEIVHAFLYESGLDVCSGTVDSWATFEEIVDWIALQHEKLHTAYIQAGAI